jgi:hypothetical protein
MGEEAFPVAPAFPQVIEGIDGHIGGLHWWPAGSREANR